MALVSLVALPSCDLVLQLNHYSSSLFLISQCADEVVCHKYFTNIFVYQVLNSLTSYLREHCSLCNDVASLEFVKKKEKKKDLLLSNIPLFR